MLLPALLAAPCEARLAEVLGAAVALRGNHLREAGATLLAAFQWGHYSKVRARHLGRRTRHRARARGF